MSAFAHITAIFACLICALTCFAVATSAFVTSDEEDDYRGIGVAVAAIPGIAFSLATLVLIFDL